MRVTTLRTNLIALTLATLVPVVVLAEITGYFLVEQQRATFRRGAEERTLAMASAIDAMLHSSVSTLQALSTLSAFDNDDLARIRDRATRVLATQPEWLNINLALPSGQQVMSLRFPRDAALPDNSKFVPDWESKSKTNAPWVSDLIIGPATGDWNFAVRVLVVRNDAAKYVLSAVVDPGSINKLLERQNIPSTWVAAVFDQKNRTVARNVDSEKMIGKLASQTLRDALAHSPSGWFRGITNEGLDVYTAYRRSEATGWTFAIGIPRTFVEAVAWRSLWIFGAGLIGATLLAIALAAVIGRRISAPIGQLASATEAIRRGERPTVSQTTPIAEVQILARTLHDSLEALYEREKALRAAGRAKDEFLAMMSHELRNPLAALVTAAYLLRVSDPVSQTAAEARGVINRQTKHMAKLIEDLLDISRLTMGKADLARECFDLGEKVQRTVSALAATGKLANHEVVTSIESVWVDADPTRIEQMVLNLLDNALKFTAPGSMVRVTVRREDSQAMLTVADTGEGIAAQDLEWIFEPFTQTAQGAARGRGGMGVGLALVKRLVEVHGGSVAAASEGVGRGATLTVRLPLIEKPTALPVPKSSPALGSTSRRVVIIEDNDDMREMLRAALASIGHEVRATANGTTSISGYRISMAMRSLGDCAQLKRAKSFF